MSDSLSCQTCLSPVRSGQAFCANCGAPLAGVQDSQPEAKESPASDLTLQPSGSFTVGTRPWESGPSSSPEAAPTAPPPVTTADAPAPPQWAAVARTKTDFAAVPTAPPAPTPIATATATPAPAPAPAPAPGSVKAALALPETTQELVAFGLSAAGAALAIASFFLPWTGVSGVGIGSTGVKVVSNQWAFAMPAAIPMLLISVLSLAAITVSDRAQVELPRFAAVIARATDLFLPLILGGLYLGVALLYMTLPFGYGMGIIVLVMAAALLIGGAVVAVASPPHPTPKPE